jgi:signal transduction histidine kinase/ActR/RegA family two-component response regulator
MSNHLPDKTETRPAQGWPVPDWFWDEIRKNSPGAAYLTGVIGAPLTALGATLDLAYLSGTQAVVASLLRALGVGYFFSLAVLAKVKPAFIVKHYDALVLGILGVATAVLSFVGAWVPGGFGNLYFVGLLEAELAIFIFLPIPPRKLIPAVLLSNGIFLWTGLATGNPVDDTLNNLVVTFVFFLVLGLGVLHATLRPRFRSFLDHQRTVALATHQTQRGDLLEEAVQARTSELAKTYETLQQQSQERLAAERALREAESRYRMTIENSVSLVFEVRPDLSCRLVRAPQKELFNRPTEEIDVEAICHGFHNDDHKAFQAMLAACRTDFRSRRIRTRVNYETGPWYWFEWSCSFFQGADGKPTGVLLARDITQELHLQKEVERQSRLAAVGQLAAGITHDFNNALAGVRLGIDAAVAAGPLPKEAEDHLRRAAESAHRARTIVRRILDFGKRSPTVTEPVDMATFAAECAGFLRHVLTDDVVIEVDAREAAWANVDVAQLEQAVVNLAVNAKDAMANGGVLRLRVERLPAAVRLHIADNGTGMTEEVMAHLFEPFFTTKGEQGTGLGLAQVYGLVRQNSGAVHVDSAPGRGTCFTLEFPRLEAPDIAGGYTDAVDERVLPLPNWRILLVEDDQALRTLFELMLTNLGVQPIAVGSAQAALDVLENEQTPFDLLITDQSMPNMSGRDLALQVKRLYPALKILLITGLLTEERLLEPAPPFDGVLLKPFDVTDLRQALVELGEAATAAR